MPVRPIAVPPALTVFAALALGATGVQAAAVAVTVSDSTGRPVADAVVTLEPGKGRLPVKPMAGVEIGQVKRQFTPRVTVVTTGTAVSFPNFDTVRHHVYSFSAAKTFELKLYAGVPGTPVVFDKPGIAVLGCNIHDPMVAWVVVVDTPHHGRTDAQGRVRLDGVAAGSYRLRTWHAGWPPDKEPPIQPVQVAAADQDVAVQLAAPAGP